MADRIGRILVAALVLGSTSAGAEVVRIDITSREPMNNGQAVGPAGPFEILRGKVYGEIDPSAPHNRIIQDIGLAPRNARGRVEYVATFALAKPASMARAARVLLYQVVNRGNGQAVASPEGYVSLVSGWQGDVLPTPSNQTIVVPIAKQKDGSPITGPVLARFVDVPDGATTAQVRLASLGPLQPYPPVDLAQPQATLTWHTSENYDGVKDASRTVPRADWVFADCSAAPWPGTRDPSRICLKDGFRAGRIYELVYTARDPLVLGVGLAATRDVVSFFRYAGKDAAGTPNPVGGAIDHAISVGDSQSGNLIRTFIHLGFNQDERNRMVWDGAFPRIAARQTPMNLRFALPGGAAGMYEPGSDGVVWWTRYEDEARGLKAAGLLDRCTATKTCPKVIEAFGSAEFWGLRLSPDLVGTDARRDLPLPANVRRYYYPGTTHGGGRGGFRVDVAATADSRCTLPENPNPEADQTRALTRALVEWVMKDTPPPASRYPTLASGDLVPATRAAIGLSDIPGLPFNDRILNPVLRYDFGAGFDALDLSGVMSVVPPRILSVLPTLVPRVNEDGNETAGVPSVQMQAPLGTYLGWNTVRSGFFAGQGCGFQGGWIPFAKTKAERLANHDPRSSLEERYGTHEDYVTRVRRAAEQAVRDRFLLPEDAARIVGEAEASDVLRQTPPSAKAMGGSSGVAVLLVDTDRVAGTIDERIYGQFLEEINHSVVDGLYAEQVRGQGFEGKDFADYWTPFGENGEATLVATKFERGEHSVRLSARKGATGLRQGRLYVEAGQTYDGSLWLSPEQGTLAVSVRILSSAGRELAKQPLKTNRAGWQEVAFLFTSPVTDPQASLELVATGTGSVLVDFISLMRRSARASGKLRPDLLAALKGLAPPFIRWPGGSYASIYKWKDGIGPAVSRKYNPNTIWGGYSDYYGFGTDEFLELCRQLGAAPMIVLAATGTDPAQLEYALEWVHYLVDPPTTEWGRRRAANGHPEPYRVPYIQIDNEPMNHKLSPDEYAAIVNLYGPRLREIAPQSKIVACGQKRSNDMNWSEKLIDLAGLSFDILGAHNYEYEPENYATGVRRIEDYLEKLVEYVRRSAHPEIQIAVLEWGAARTYDWRAGLHAAGSLLSYEKLSPALALSAPALLMRNTTDDPEWRSWIYHDHVSWFAGSGYVAEKLFRDYYAPRRHAFTSGTFKDIPRRADFFDAISQMKPEDWTPNTVDALATSTADGRRLIIKAVNYDGAPHTLLTRLQGSGVPATATVKMVTLTAGLDEANSLAEPGKLRRQETTKPYTLDMAFELPAYTVAVIEIRAN